MILPRTFFMLGLAFTATVAAREYCKVLGGIRPVDPSAQDIRFEVNLPTNWNHKAVQFGGGSFDGWLGATNGLKRTPVTRPLCVYPDWPKYKGSGDVNAASSFACATQ